MADRGVPSTAAVLATLVGVSLRRLSRSRSVWVVAMIALLPVVLAAALQRSSEVLDVIIATEIAVMALLPSIFVASAIGEEIEDRTTTYLWSRPLPRWTIFVGKLIALAPVAAALVVASWLLATQLVGRSVPLRSTLGFGAGALGVSCVAAGIALLVPKHGMSLSIVYLVLIDLVIGAIPASLQSISITHQVTQIVTESVGVAKPAITMAAIACVWLAIGLVRVRRLES